MGALLQIVLNFSEKCEILYFNFARECRLLHVLRHRNTETLSLQGCHGRRDPITLCRKVVKSLGRSRTLENKKKRKFRRKLKRKQKRNG